MRQKLRDNGLSIVVFLIFALTLIGQSITGHHVYNEEQKEHQQALIGYWQYLVTGHFIEAVFENWESEFLQMGMYVLLTACLFQKGSAESKDPDKEEEVDKDPEQSQKEDSPKPVKKGGLGEKIYENSLSIALLSLFVVSFMLHAAGGAKAYSEEQLAHGEKAVGTLAYIATSQFWFESFQNWQSEFFSIGVIVVLTIFLRQKGSPQSKPVAASNEETGA